MHDTIDRIAAAAGRQTVEVPVRFKNVCEQMLERDVLIGGEESGVRLQESSSRARRRAFLPAGGGNVGAAPKINCRFGG